MDKATLNESERPTHRPLVQPQSSHRITDCGGRRPFPWALFSSHLGGRINSSVGNGRTYGARLADRTGFRPSCEEPVRGTIELDPSHQGPGILRFASASLLLVRISLAALLGTFTQCDPGVFPYLFDCDGIGPIWVFMRRRIRITFHPNVDLCSLVELCPFWAGSAFLRSGHSLDNIGRFVRLPGH